MQHAPGTFLSVSSRRGLGPKPDLAIVLLACSTFGCASAARETGAGALRPGAVYVFNTTVRGINQYHDRLEEFNVNVAGQFSLLPSGHVSVSSTHGSCPELQVGSPGLPAKLSGSTYDVWCGGLRLQVRAAGGGTAAGSVSVLIDEIHEERGNCLDYAFDPTTGQRGACIQYDWLEKKVRRWSAVRPTVLAAL